MITAVAFLALLASPSPPPTATPAVCSRDATASVPAQPEFPKSARGKMNGTARVHITVAINPDGSVKSERVTSSSGIAALDQAALTAAGKSTYLPRIVNCKAVPGVYYFFVTFTP